MREAYVRSEMPTKRLDESGEKAMPAISPKKSCSYDDTMIRWEG